MKQFEDIINNLFDNKYGIKLTPNVEDHLLRIVRTCVNLYEYVVFENYYGFTFKYHNPINEVAKHMSFSIPQTQKHLLHANKKIRQNKALFEHILNHYGVLDQSLSNTSIPSRIIKILQNNNINTVNILKNMSTEDLLKIKGIGPKYVELIQNNI